jgi:hypothetical protein
MTWLSSYILTAICKFFQYPIIGLYTPLWTPRKTCQYLSGLEILEVRNYTTLQHCHMGKLYENPHRNQRVVQYFLFSSSKLLHSFWFYYCLHFCPLVFNPEGVLYFRISTYALITILHNTIIVDFPCCLIVTYSLLLIHLFWPISCCSVRFPIPLSLYQLVGPWKTLRLQFYCLENFVQHFQL